MKPAVVFDAPRGRKRHSISRALAFGLSLLPACAAADAASPEAALDMLVSRCLTPMLAGEAPDFSGLDLIEPEPENQNILANARLSGDPDDPNGEQSELQLIEEDGLLRCHLTFLGIGRGSWTTLNDGFEKRLARTDLRELPPCIQGMFTFYEGPARHAQGKVVVADTFRTREGLMYMHAFSVREKHQPYSKELSCYE